MQAYLAEFLNVTLVKSGLYLISRRPQEERQQNPKKKYAVLKIHHSSCKLKQIVSLMKS